MKIPPKLTYSIYLVSIVLLIIALWLTNSPILGFFCAIWLLVNVAGAASVFRYMMKMLDEAEEDIRELNLSLESKIAEEEYHSISHTQEELEAICTDCGTHRVTVPRVIQVDTQNKPGAYKRQRVLNHTSNIHPCNQCNSWLEEQNT